MKILVLEHSPLARRIIGEEFLSSSYEVINADTIDVAPNYFVPTSNKKSCDTFPSIDIKP